MPNATRWNSLFDALRHIQKMVECSDNSKAEKAKITKDLSILKEYPHIKTLYLQYITGLPASAACERLFSLGARVLIPTRSLLSDKNFERLVFFIVK